MSDRARMWQRVSTGGQDEASQLPDLVAWCDAHRYGYSLAESYVVKASAYHGKQIKLLEQAVADMESGAYDVLVFWAADRMWRSDQADQALALVARIVATGGRMEFIEDTDLNRAPDQDVWRWYEDFARVMGRAHKESKRKAARIRIKQDALRSAGSVVGRAAFGYEIVQRGAVKAFAPTDTGREYVPEIFRMAVAGASLRAIAKMLTDAGVRTETGLATWNEGFLSRLIKNPVYYGARRNAGALDTEALVTFSVWQAANAKIASRARPGRDAAAGNVKAFLRPVCGNPQCSATGAHPSPMYPINAYGGRKYRCSGSGPQRKGCGNLVDLATLDATVAELLITGGTQAHTERVFVPGDDRADQVGRLREAGADAMRKGDYQAATDAMRQAEELEGQPASRPHWTERATGQSEAEYVASLDLDTLRTYVAERMTVTAWNAGSDAPVVAVGPRVADWQNVA